MWGTDTEDEGVPSRATTCTDPLGPELPLEAVGFLTATTRVVTETVVPLPLGLAVLDFEKKPRSEVACLGACMIMRGRPESSALGDCTPEMTGYHERWYLEVVNMIAGPARQDCNGSRRTSIKSRFKED